MTGLSRRLTWLLALAFWAVCSLGVGAAAWLHIRHVQNQAMGSALARAEIASRAVEQMLMRSFEAIDGIHEQAEARQRLLVLGQAQAVAAIEAQFKGIADQARFGVRQVAVIGTDGILAWSSVPGWTPVNLTDRPHFQGPRDASGHQPYISIPLIGRTTAQWSVQVTRRIDDGTGRFAGVAVVSLDPIALVRALQELQLGEGRRIRILRQDGVVIADSEDRPELGIRLEAEDPLRRALALAPNGRAEATSPGGLRLIGYQSLEGVPLVVELSLDAAAELASIDFVAPSISAAATAICLLLLAAIALSISWLEHSRTQQDLVQARRDRESVLERLAHAQRMESLGRLAGGIAHDFNNVLQAAIGGAKLIARRSADPGIRKLAEMVISAGERGASVTQRLLAFARRGQLRAEAIEIAPLFEGLREVLSHTLGAIVEVRVAVAPDLPPAMADRGQLEAVLINLAVNARDAMRSMGGGRLVLGAVLDNIGEGRPGLAPGRYLRLDVSDSGSGMDAATLAQAAEPFFTTKPKDQGTGLGLAMATGFAQQSGGTLAIDSAPGKGTRVTLWLPEADEVTLRRSPPPHAGAELPEGARVLLVDDEPLVRRLLAEWLRERGLVVVEAEGGRDALALLARETAFDLMITDLAMPGMNGLQLIEAIRLGQPRLPALLLTGHPGDADATVLRLVSEAGAFTMLRKPVAPEAVLAGCAALLLPQPTP
ncbi:response regulator [Roseomonas sp. 18066]|uniref:response regulator n=1 Tax=Roseomonas sp. 18066 TaxID=2681412 RepID=UPI00135860D5|nr:response regulator [Roseomonas sp. 18066]